MKSRIAVVLMVLIALIMCAGCSSTISMPYSSKEYENGEWTIEELEKHFKELGFAEIEFYGDTTIITDVLVEDEDSYFGSFEKGDEIDTSRKIGIYTEYEDASSLTVENCPELVEFVENGIESQENSEAWMDFLESHSGDYIEFDGTITDWYDELFWVGVDFMVAIEDSEHMSFSKGSVDLIDLGMTGKYHYKQYHVGLIKEGMRVHVITEIVQTEDGWDLELDSMQVIE